MNDNRFRVLVIEPDEQELETTKTQLKEMGITVRSAHSFAECNDLLDAGEVHLVLARLCSSPDETLTSCALVRARCAIPIILLVGRGTIVDEDRIIAAGADDYIITPSSTRIFAARLNHQRTRTSTRHRTDGDTLVWANLLLDTTGRHCLIGDIEIHLTSSEYRLLELLLTDRQRVHTRTQIADAIGSYAGSSSSHSVDAHVSRLRKKITENGCPDPIRVVRGVGFGLAAIPPPRAMTARHSTVWDWRPADRQSGKRTADMARSATAFQASRPTERDDRSSTMRQRTTAWMRAETATTSTSARTQARDWASPRTSA